jgi:hypothetical protein
VQNVVGICKTGDTVANIGVVAREHLAAREEAEIEGEPKQQESKPNTDAVSETFAELVEDWKKTDGREFGRSLKPRSTTTPKLCQPTSAS